jgi:hypothetical protein
MGNPPKKTRGQGTGPRRIDGITLCVRSAAALIGCTEKTLRGHVARQLIPFRRLGGRIIFIRAELEGFLTTLPGVSLDEAKSNLELRA